MKKKTARRTGLLLALAVTAGLITACGGARTEAATPEWCPTVAGHQVDCGTVQRSIVAGQPELGQVDVAYARIRHSDASKATAGTITPNPGGPGVPLISHAPEAVQLIGDLLSDHDLLLIDPRGTGLSGPLECGGSEADHQFGNREQQRKMAADCATALGPKAAGYTSAATADDFDAVRAHLEIPKLVLYGISYGTYLTPVYAQRHPDTVQSMVLTGAYPADADRLARPNAEAVSLALQRICERSGVCDGNQAVADLRTVAARLRTTPLEFTSPRPFALTEAKLATWVFEAATSNVGADPTAMTPLGLLPAALRGAATGDDTGLRQWAELIAGQAAYENIGAYLTITCNDYPTIWSPNADAAQRREQYDAAIAAAGELGAFSAAGFAAGQRDGGDACLDWPATTATRPHDMTEAMPNVPVLVLSGDLDAITPDSNGKLAAARFPHATFISVPNTGHVPDLEPSGCVIGVIGNFIRTGEPGATECVRAIPPIAVAPVAR
ncbi:alpha/beta fold hydrolase [Nocardia yamanashiensis]|uniref:alpha/beta fold hydrolase n=1 Tax=Nocardia yamanashiensis TaxID=209247 RepID=UPI00082A9A79|nr:alpha/beta fold hydrolase [Nocardia yamanashiensis]